MASPLILVHVPKTAGVTLINALLAYYQHMGPSAVCDFHQDSAFQSLEQETAEGRERVRRYVTGKVLSGDYSFVTGHIFHLPEVDARYMVFLRNPVDRLISWFYYMTSRNEYPIDRELAQLTLSEFVDQIPERWSFLLTDQIVRINEDCRPETALDILRSFWFLGITEYFDASLVLLAGQHDPPLFYQNSYNVGGYRKPEEALRSRLARMMPEEMALYHEAKHLFLDRLSQLGISEADVARFRENNAHYEWFDGYVRKQSSRYCLQQYRQVLLAGNAEECLSFAKDHPSIICRHLHLLQDVNALDEEITTDDAELLILLPAAVPHLDRLMKLPTPDIAWSTALQSGNEASISSFQNLNKPGGKMVARSVSGQLRPAQTMDVHRTLFFPYVTSRSCLFHHDFRFEGADSDSPVLLVRTSCMEHFLTISTRILELLPAHEINILTNRPTPLPHERKPLHEILYPEGPMSLRTLTGEIRARLLAPRFGMILFILDIPLDPTHFAGFEETYQSWWYIYEVASFLGLDRAFVVDRNYRIFPFSAVAKAREIQTVKGPLLIPHASMFQEECQLAYDLAYAHEAQGETVEFGQYLGGSTACLALGCLHSGRQPVWSADIEPSPIAQQNLRGLGLDGHVRAFPHSSDHFQSLWGLESRRIRLLYYDSCKDFASVLKDLLYWRRYLAPDAVMILQDYNSTGEVARAVHHLVKEDSGFEFGQEVASSLVLHNKHY